MIKPEAAIKTISDLRFGQWTFWRDRGEIQGLRHPGIYILAIFKHGAPKVVDPLASEVVYVGETSGQDLRSRWNQFHRSAFEGKFGHSGGTNYRKMIGDGFRYLYVAGLPYDFDEPYSSTYIRYLERLVLLEFVVRHGRRPTCNLK